MNRTHAIPSIVLLALALTGLAIGGTARAADSPLADVARKAASGYLSIASALSDDEAPPTQAMADVVEQASQAPKLTKGLAPEQAKELASAAADLEKAGKSMQADRDLATWRTHLRDLTGAVDRFARLANGGALPPELNEFHCPMANANWLQSGTAPANPYFGKAMRACGTRVRG
ncbi:MAG: hypothetical protein U0166_00885 [Acidobacteriota bacterium]